MSRKALVPIQSILVIAIFSIGMSIASIDMMLGNNLSKITGDVIYTQSQCDNLKNRLFSLQGQLASAKLFNKKICGQQSALEMKGDPQAKELQAECQATKKEIGRIQKRIKTAQKQIAKYCAGY